jgi:hypothetical protein
LLREAENDGCPCGVEPPDVEVVRVADETLDSAWHGEVGDGIIELPRNPSGARESTDIVGQPRAGAEGLDVEDHLSVDPPGRVGAQ